MFLTGTPTNTEGTFVIAQGQGKVVGETDYEKIKSGYRVSFKKNEKENLVSRVIQSKNISYL